MDESIEIILKERIKDHEALRLDMYTDSEGILTIGYGHNLEKKPISKRAANVIFEDDFAEAKLYATKIPEYHAQCSARRAVLIEMVFNIGYAGVMKFSRMRAAMERDDFVTAASEMLDSKWAGQVGNRAIELSHIMNTGVYKF